MFKQHNKRSEVNEDFEVYEIYEDKKGEHHELLNPRRNSLDQNNTGGVKRNNRRNSTRYDPSVTQNTHLRQPQGISLNTYQEMIC